METKFYERLKTPTNVNRLKQQQQALLGQVLHNSFEMDNKTLELTEGPEFDSIIHDDMACQIVMNNIRAHNLPIKFKISGLLGVSVIATRPGLAVIMLVDCLCKHEGQTIGIEQIVDLYGNGFYNELCLENYVDNYLKPNKCSWSHLYSNI